MASRATDYWLLWVFVLPGKSDFATLLTPEMIFRRLCGMKIFKLWTFGGWVEATHETFDIKSGSTCLDCMFYVDHDDHRLCVQKILWESDHVLHVRSLWSVLVKGGWCNISIVPIRNHNMLSSQSTRKLIIRHKPTWTACQEFSMNCSFVWRDLVDLSKCRGVRKNITGNHHMNGKNKVSGKFSHKQIQW